MAKPSIRDQEIERDEARLVGALTLVIVILMLAVVVLVMAVTLWTLNWSTKI